MLDIKVEQKEGLVTMFLEGRIDNEGTQSFQDGLNSLLEIKKEKVVLNFSKLEFINSSGIGKLLIFYKKTDQSGAETEIDGISEELFSLFRAIRLDKLIKIKR